ncbi:biotin-independent malonate decarboxylase subunit gamma [Anaeromyxobacter sp. SG17]|uniref:biotin-independent malonate decarboxylase subunit gamma n=1 Tax=Anaeromyxobacter sp. SG17 TaxID=2925405 RepID=UPI001F59D9B4|nr:biotin-independent malonate decarboxylase subunit gamma [Anaeromyxobacter sp. SG17]
MSGSSSRASRGATWLAALTGADGAMQGGPASVRVVDAPLGEERARFLAVVPDPGSRFPRARSGEVGLAEAWTLARHVRGAIAADADGGRRPLVAIVDVTSQAYGRCEELLGIHLACAAAVDAYATARLSGHPVVALLVGSAMSGAFLAHGYQANRIVALDDPGVLVHAMGKSSAARVTRRSVAEVEALGEKILPMAYDVRAFARLGLVDELVGGVNADAPTGDDAARVRRSLVAAVASARSGARHLGCRLTSEAARETRAASIEVRRRLVEQWSGA